MKTLRITAGGLWCLVFLVLGFAAQHTTPDGGAGFILGLIGGGGAYLIAKGELF